MSTTLSGIVSYYENWTTYSHFWQNGALFISTDTALTRNILTTIFVILNFAIGLVGSFYLNRRNLHQLNSNKELDKKVPINYLTSWLTLGNTLSYAWNTFQLPAGYYGLLMLITGVFSLVNQFFVNSFVSSIPFQSTCPFEFGLVTTQIPSYDNGNIIPSSTLSSAITLYNAQYQVWANGGEMGIWKKVNYTSVTFKPTTDDVLGGWNCSYAPSSTITSAQWANQTAFNSYIDKQIFLYPEYISWAGRQEAYGDAQMGFMAWSANRQDGSTEQWDLRALIATNLTGSSVPVTNLECNLVAGPGWTPPIMPSNRSLDGWSHKTFGFIMNAQPEYYAFYMEWILNGMVMLTGSGNYDRFDTSVLPEGASTYYGCNLTLTQIKVEVWVILGIGSIILLVLLLVDLFFALFHFIQLKRGNHKDIATVAPASLPEWQLALLRGVTGNDKIKPKEMRHYSYGWDSSRQKYVFDTNEVFQGILLSREVVEPSLLSTIDPIPEQTSFLKSESSVAAV